MMYKFFCGIDIGSLFVKFSFYLDKTLANKVSKHLRELGAKKTEYLLDNAYIFVLEPIKLGKDGDTYKDASAISKEYIELVESKLELKFDAVLVSGRGQDFAKENGYQFISEFQAIAEFFKIFYPEIKSVFEIGAENSKYLALNNGAIEDYETNGECAAGTGSFLDQQGRRLKFTTEELSKQALSATRTAYIAGRCSVFAKSDMIHAQQKGYSPQEILLGLTESIAENYRANILKTKEYKTPSAFIGGVALNDAVVLAMKRLLKVDKMLVPEYPNMLVSIGLSTMYRLNKKDFTPIKINKTFPRLEKLSRENVVFLRDKVKLASLDTDKKTDAFLGIDIGSVSTNLVLIDKNGVVIKEIYLKTAGRPIDAVNTGLQELVNLKDRVNILGVATTGSGRELIGALIGADFIKDEITAHKTGASFVSKKYFSNSVDTIFEIGGQDSKYISLDDGVVVDFHMNEACSAGTGSFLEEQAEKLGINIKEEFASLALKADGPINLGDRCTVFIEKDLNSYYEQGAKIENLLAGLSYSIVNNYLNRVVKGRKIGEVVYFQGGTAYNDAVACAFASVLGKTIVVPPHNGVMGALGVAIIAKEKYAISPYKTKFRGYDLNAVSYTLREFTCKSCSNKCTIQEFTVEGEKTYWGDKCSDKFRKTVKTGLKPSSIDFVAKREELLFEDYNTRYPKNSRPSIGFPRAMYFWDRLPFWSAFIDTLGFDLVLSEPTTYTIAKQGTGSVISEPCFPIKLSHGHVLNLMDKKVDYILLPSMINAEPSVDKKDAVVGRPQFYFCPWGQTLPDVISNNKKFYAYKDKFIKPKLELREGDDFVINDLYQEFKKFSNLKKRQVRKAYFEGKQALINFQNNLYKVYAEEVKKINALGRELIVLLGRPYNVNDPGINLNIARKLRDNYGVNVIPMDYIPALDRTQDVTYNMFWNYGRKILSLLREVADKDKIHPIYITNFECGPDSYIKHFVSKALNGKSILTLQFDEHANDAGILTRVEAYLDSKGVFDYVLYKDAKQEGVELGA